MGKLLEKNEAGSDKLLTNINQAFYPTKILWDKTVPAAYAEGVGVVYLLEKSLTRFYNIFPV